MSHDGIVYSQKDLGPRTGAPARRIKVFDPDSSWVKVAAR